VLQDLEKAGHQSLSQQPDVLYKWSRELCDDEREEIAVSVEKMPNLNPDVQWVLRQVALNIRNRVGR
jgi:hypothetical protein